MKIAIYARFSDDELQNDNSIEDQVRISRARAETEGWQVVKVYSDHGKSGASMLLRPAIQELMEDVSLGKFSLVMTEGLDRLSRDQEDVAGIYKRIKFAGADIYSISDGGIVSEIHIGLKGTMNALFLKDLAIKTHRGLSGRVQKGKSGGGLSYGYRVVKQLGDDGEVHAGEREIIPDEADIIRQIFEDYANGLAPKKIARNLNSALVPSPSKGEWSASTINGNRRRGTGILNNELYLGRIVWNRLKYIKDPDTGKRVSRLNPENEWQIVDVPHLRIITQSLWDRVKARQKILDEKPRFQAKQRPPKLLSFLLKCGCCGNGMSIVSHERYGCSTSRNKGTCDNRLTIKQDILEHTVISAMQNHLMQPKMVAIFCEEYTSFINKKRSNRFAQAEKYKKELNKLEKDKHNIIEAIKNGFASDELRDSLNAISKRREEIESYLREQDEPQVLLHPNMAKRYQEEIEKIIQSLNHDDTRIQAAETLRGMIDKIVLTPKQCGKEYSIDLHGDLAGILSVAVGRKSKITEYDPFLQQVASIAYRDNNKSSDIVSGLCKDFPMGSLCKDKLVAGVGFEPTTFRL